MCRFMGLYRIFYEITFNSQVQMLPQCMCPAGMEKTGGVEYCTSQNLQCFLNLPTYCI